MTVPFPVPAEGLFATETLESLTQALSQAGMPRARNNRSTDRSIAIGAYGRDRATTFPSCFEATY